MDVCRTLVVIIKNLNKYLVFAETTNGALNDSFPSVCRGHIQTVYFLYINHQLLCTDYYLFIKY